MPQPYWKEGRFPREFSLTLRGAAAEHLLLGYYCSNCRRLTWFLASDLVKILNPRLAWYVPHYECGKCGDTDISVRQRFPEDGDYGNLQIRRPAGIKRVQMWANVKLGDDAPDLGFPTKQQLAQAHARNPYKIISDDKYNHLGFEGPIDGDPEKPG